MKPVDEIPPKTPLQKKVALRKNPIKFSQYLANYSLKINKDLDQFWDEKDYDKNGYLDKSEALVFVIELTNYFEDNDRANNFSVDNFQKTFDEFDEDKNGFLDKAEMAVLIKKMVKRNYSQKFRQTTKQNAEKTKSLMELLGGYTSNFCIDLDEAWIEKDTDKNGYLDKEECRAFFSKIKNFIIPLRAQNFDDEDFDELF